MSGWDRELPPGDRSEKPNPWVDVRAPGHVPFPNAKSFIARLEAICREHHAVGEKGFAYHGIEDDIRAENAAAKAELEGSARVPGEEG